MNLAGTRSIGMLGGLTVNLRRLPFNLCPRPYDPNARQPGELGEVTGESARERHVASTQATSRSKVIIDAL
jgi:hypothetical protein